MRRIGVILALTGLLFFPALAGEGHTGWHVGVEGSSVQAGNSDVLLGVPYGSSEGQPAGRLITVDFGSGTAFGAHVGRTTERGDLTLSFWNYDEDASRTAMDAVDGFLPAFPNADLGADFADRLDGISSLQATVIDLTWSRPFAKTEDSTWNWQIGLRSWQQEQETLLTTDLDPETQSFEDQQHLDSDADGLGILVGFSGEYHFTERIFGSTNLKLAFLTGSVDVFNREDAFGEMLDTTMNSADRNFRQMDLDTRINFNVVGGLDLFIGYQFKQFDDAVTNFNYVDDVQEGLLRAATTNTSFSGISFGANFFF